MTALRHRLKQHNLLFAGLIALALLLKIVVPTGYMIGGSAGAITIELCSGTAPQRMVMAMPGMAHHADKKGEQSKADMPCAFAGAAVPSLAAIDPLLLAGAIAFILVTVFRIAARSTPPGPPPRLRPPLRAPPVFP